jgi:hypothetical protein
MVVQVVLGGEADAAEHLLAVFGSGQRGLARGGLRQQGGEIRVFGPGQAQRRLGAFDGHQRLGQPVPDRLERRDRSAELNPVQRMLTRQGQHRPCRPDQPPAHCSARLEQPHRLAVGHPAQWQAPKNRVRRVRRVRAFPHHPATAVRHGRRPAGQAADRLKHYVVENRGVRTCFAQQPEHQRYRHIRHVGQHVGPAQIGQRRVQFGAGDRQHRLAQGVFEQFE